MTTFIVEKKIRNNWDSDIFCYVQPVRFAYLTLIGIFYNKARAWKPVNFSNQFDEKTSGTEQQ
jgi:hypothetical protein